MDHRIRWRTSYYLRSPVESAFMVTGHWASSSWSQGMPRSRGSDSIVRCRNWRIWRSFHMFPHNRAINLELRSLEHWAQPCADLPQPCSIQCRQRVAQTASICFASHACHRLPLLCDRHSQTKGQGRGRIFCSFFLGRLPKLLLLLACQQQSGEPWNLRRNWQTWAVKVCNPKSQHQQLWHRCHFYSSHPFHSLRFTCFPKSFTSGLCLFWCRSPWNGGSSLRASPCPEACFSPGLYGVFWCIAFLIFLGCTLSRLKWIEEKRQKICKNPFVAMALQTPGEHPRRTYLRT